MALEGYKSNNNVVYSSKYHCVWTPKYRRRVLVGPIAKRWEQVMRKTAERYRAEIIALEIMPDHVPDRYFVSTVGGAPLAVIKQYVENQKDV